MTPFEAKIRSYGWYCSRCKEHKSLDRVWVAKVSREGATSTIVTVKEWIGIVCKDCNTELTDCFVARKYYQIIKTWCETCEDKFQCFTMSEAQIEKPLVKAYPHEIHAKTPLHQNGILGIQSYTGKIYDKLEQDKLFCKYPERDDCNHSYMRAAYTGESYRRCRDMKYDKNNKKWYCLYGKQLRGE